MKTVVALRHLAFEDLGSFGPLLAGRGFRVDYVEAPLADLGSLDPTAAELWVVLGGPIGAYEDESYPFLAEEIALIEQRLAAGRATLGLCLGAQLMARALGARVYPGGRKEIGWAPIELTEAGRRSCLAPFADGTPVLHWHGDSFDLPAGAELLASTGLYANQAFAKGDALLALQFHPEVIGAELERWLVGHAVEIAAAGLSAVELRAASWRHGNDLARRGGELLTCWLDRLSL